MRFEEHGLALADRMFELRGGHEDVLSSSSHLAGFDMLDLNDLSEIEKTTTSQRTLMFLLVELGWCMLTAIFVLIDELGIMPERTLRKQIYFRITNYWKSAVSSSSIG